MTMILNPFALAFMALWLGPTVASALSADPLSLSAWKMFAVGVGICTVAFIPEAVKAKSLLTDIILNIRAVSPH
jgi:hypothetical protein